MPRSKHRVALFLLLGVLASIALTATAQEKQDATVQASPSTTGTELAEVEETLQSAQDGTDDVASLWTKARKLGKCINGRKLVECNGEYDFSYSGARGHKHHKRFAPKHDGKTYQEYASEQQSSESHKHGKHKPSKYESADEMETDLYKQPPHDAEDSYSHPDKPTKKKHHKQEGGDDADAGEGGDTYDASARNSKNHSKKWKDTPQDEGEDAPEYEDEHSYQEYNPVYQGPGAGRYKTKPPTTSHPPKPNSKYLRKDHGKSHGKDHGKAGEYEASADEPDYDMVSKPSKSGKAVHKLWDYRWGANAQAASTISVKDDANKVHIVIDKPPKRPHRRHALL